MKHYIFLLLSLFLAACAEKDISGGDGTAGTGSGLRLSVRLSSGVATRALGDPFASGKEEKRIDRLAFFVHTAEDGFQVYPPVPDDVTDPDLAATGHPNAVYLSGTPETGYTATVALTAGGGYLADIIAIANLPADYDYNQIVTWQGLCDSVALHAATMPACLPGSDETNKADRNAFVMYGDIRKELKKEETNAFAFVLQRLVARIDITNEAYAPGTIPANAATGPENSFFLTSARLLHAQPAAYLVPKPDVTPDVVTTNDWPAITGIGTDILYGKPTAKTPADDPTQEPEKVAVTTADDAKAARLQYAWHTLYTYPNSDTEHAPTALEIKGTFRGTEITRQIPFVDKDGNAFPVEGNHRYLVRIVKAPGQTDISYSIAVSEWDAVDTVNVKPDQTAVPEITKLDCNGVYVEKEKRYDVYYKVDGLLTFDATCNFSAGVRVKYYDNKNETWTTQGDWVKVEKTAETPVTKVIAGYKSSFKVTFYKFDTGVSRKAMLLVHNGGSEVECDTIFIKHTITYPGTDLEPVALGNITGKDIVWAPVNVGATRLPTTAYNSTFDLELNSEELQTKVEERGLLFQWGRKSGVVPTYKVPRVSGMINMEELQSNFGFKDKLIDGSGGGGVDADWLTPSDNTLWGNGITKGVYDPCPEGWRVPSKEELQVLADKANIDGIWDNSDCNLSFSDSELVFSENVGILYMVAWNDITTFPDKFSIWSYSVDNGTQGAFYFKRSGGSYELSRAPRSSAIPVRCVQE
ncbi:fibrobacter succinogenes major paralogous domain-containing protein [Parabacteroides sp. HGS0025]|uniref:hypothetical protein n=1 Tax=Parabacteroides sp. HGS0025 TaxID=1078087 RepID=UPI00061738F4|nr:hypothetical protein [Parabacteroides sp. HGS0025]KKB53147.1 fibrobacter succinogenes major paralogous domain-containing protein [Parabacteroides sp. HGS0025]